MKWDYKVNFDDQNVDEMYCALGQLYNIVDNINDEYYSDKLVNIMEQLEEVMSEMDKEANTYPLSEREEREIREMNIAVSNGFLYD